MGSWPSFDYYWRPTLRLLSDCFLDSVCLLSAGNTVAVFGRIGETANECSISRQDDIRRLFTLPRPALSSTTCLLIVSLALQVTGEFLLNSLSNFWNRLSGRIVWECQVSGE